jgi:preprotein translocase subunit Sss1
MGQPLAEGRAGAQENQPEVAKKTQVKKPYVSPALLEYGSIAKLTEAGSGLLVDGIVGFMMF